MTQNQRFKESHIYKAIITLLLVSVVTLLYVIAYNHNNFKQYNNSNQMRLREMTLKNNKLMEENMFLVSQVESLSAVQEKVNENQQIVRNFKPKEVVHVVQSNEEVPFFVRNPDLLDDAIRLHNQHSPEG